MYTLKSVRVAVAEDELTQEPSDGTWSTYAAPRPRLTEAPTTAVVPLPEMATESPKLPAGWPSVLGFVRVATGEEEERHDPWERTWNT
jgi:hypothetical protein